MNSTKALGLISATMILTAFSSQPTTAVSQSKIPNSLQVPTKQPMVLNVFAKGVQIYVCKASDANNQYKWTLKAPDAVLFNSKTGQKLGTHYAGPTWEASDGSKVVGKVKNLVQAPNPKDIPWLLLSAKSDIKTGVFSNINYIQRVDTVGGQAPEVGCDSSHVGNEVRVNYSANYYFYGAAQ
ncbi:MAG: DUF3455 domain-containing protein [Calothrix sp. FI2-JRJ7]|jgi:hypothetical protein|nr:DUF3455 domain-containing protein [Calothrix sp. FI2-JRJ7]